MLNICLPFDAVANASIVANKWGKKYNMKPKIKTPICHLTELYLLILIGSV